MTRAARKARLLPGFTELPPPLRRYLLAVAVGGPLLAAAVALAAAVRPTAHDTAVAVLLTTLAAVAHRHPLRFSHKTTVNVAGAAFLAMILILPPAFPGVLALVAIAGGYLLRRRQAFDLPEALFNLGQGGCYVTAGAVAYAALSPTGDTGPPWLRGAAEVGAILLTAALTHLLNTALVAGAVARQLGSRPLRVWRRSLAADLPAQATLTGLGVVAAVVAEAQPAALPLLALPIGLVHYALRQTVRQRADTQAALANLVDIVELRDQYTAGHSRRVAATARALALQLGLTADEADLIESAGRVHDVGKVAIDRAVLAKPGRLDPSEWAEVKRHPIDGAEVVARFASYPEGHRLVRHHHERWDGRGYPDGLAGEAIPLGARILAVADTFDALTSARPYRSALSIAEALQVLTAGAGTQWDPRVVQTLVALTRRAPAEADSPTDILVDIRPGRDEAPAPRYPPPAGEGAPLPTAPG